VLLTDGYIGNESEILAEVQQKLQPGNRLYSFGVGSSANRFLLNRIAEIGRGTCQIVRPDQPTEEVAEKFFRQINNPVLTNIQISWEGTGEAVIYPSTPPDLFAQQPLVLFGRISPLKVLRAGTFKLEPPNFPTSEPSNLQPATPTGTLRISGIAAGSTPYEQVFNITFEQTGNPAIAQLWGRARLKDLMNQMFSYEKKAGVESVTQTALSYQLLSQYTAFVAVSEEVRVDPEGNRISMQVPVEKPEGVSYEGIFGSGTVGVPRSAGRIRARHSSTDSISAKARPILESFAEAPASYSEGPVDVDSFDLTLIDPSLLSDVDEGLPRVKPMLAPTPILPHRQLQVVSATGLEQAAVANLTQHLQQLNLPPGKVGEIVFEFPVRNGRVVRVVLDEEASTVREAVVIDLIKRSLLTWRVPASATGTIRLTLRIQS
jgi:Ca-activated chloride channel family protein